LQVNHFVQNLIVTRKSQEYVGVVVLCFTPYVVLFRLPLNGDLYFQATLPFFRTQQCLRALYLNLQLQNIPFRCNKIPDRPPFLGGLILIRDLITTCGVSLRSEPRAGNTICSGAITQRHSCHLCFSGRFNGTHQAILLLFTYKIPSGSAAALPHLPSIQSRKDYSSFFA